MSLSLYAVTVPSYLQILESMGALVSKAQAWCTEHEVAPADVIQARLAVDMLPFAYQVKSTAVHSLGAIEGVRRGTFSPDNSTPPDSFRALSDRLQQTREALQAVTPKEVDDFMDRPMRFVSAQRQLDFAAQDFLLSFSLPNFYFHATTAYDILRWKGMPIGKRDYTGKLRSKF
jgi:uncharacterized protein